MRSFAQILTAMVSLALLCVPAEAVVIRDEPGGLISNHVMMFQQLREQGEPVVIDGRCYSACTLALGIIPSERLCATARAELGFHASWQYKDASREEKVLSPLGNAMLMDYYPARVRAWLERKGGLTPKLLRLRGKELFAMVQRCPN